jgi:hypothetical protein
MIFSLHRICPGRRALDSRASLKRMNEKHPIERLDATKQACAWERPAAKRSEGEEATLSDQTLGRLGSGAS